MVMFYSYVKLPEGIFQHLTAWFDHIMCVLSKHVHQQGEPRCIDALSQWLDFWIRCPTTWVLYQLGLGLTWAYCPAGHLGPRGCCYCCSQQSQRGPCSQQTHRDPVSGFLPMLLGTWHASSLTHHISSCVFGSNMQRVRVFDQQKTAVRISSRRAIQVPLQVPVLWETAWHLPIAPAGTASLPSQLSTGVSSAGYPHISQKS